MVNKYDKSGIYKITCQSCQKVYIGQTGRNLKTRFKEHIRSIRFNKDESAYAQHILNRGHQYGPIEQVMEIVEQARKGGLMNIKEIYHIHNFERRKEVIEEQRNKTENGKDNRSLLFEIAIEIDKYTDRSRSKVGDKRV
jgi:dsDNA-specific endonuclease/ATPase MutS2